MQETPAQYTRRLLGYQQGKRPVSVLTATPRRIGNLLRGATNKKLKGKAG
jgi:hypothetical protein